MWITGEAWSFQNWAPGEPNNQTTNVAEGEDALGFKSYLYPGEWNDYPASLPYSGFVVEYEPLPTPIEATTWGTIKAVFSTSGTLL